MISCNFEVKILILILFSIPGSLFGEFLIIVVYFTIIFEFSISLKILILESM